MVKRVTEEASIRVVGVDCATQPEKTGIAWADYTEGRLEGASGVSCRRGDDVSARVVETIGGRRTLLCIDAPLGWPVPMGRLLSDHTAGEPLGKDPDLFFSRETDRVVRRELGKRPLEVGANFIARTAYRALGLLGEIGDAAGMPVALAWVPDFPGRLAAIEVYPAAVIRSRHLQNGVYRTPGGAEDRLRILGEIARTENIREGLWIDELERASRTSPHVLDAFLCVVAGSDFLKGDSRAPTAEEEVSARMEGWIWFVTGRARP